MITGELTTYWETGFEGAYWALRPDAPAEGEPDIAHPRAPLYLLESGDQLEVFSADGTICWAGTITWDTETGWRRYVDGQTREAILATRPWDLLPPRDTPAPPGLLSVGGRLAQHDAWVASLHSCDQPSACPAPEGMGDVRSTIYPPQTLADALRWIREQQQEQAWADLVRVYEREREAMEVALQARSPHLTPADRVYLADVRVAERRAWRGQGQQRAGGLWVHAVQRGVEPDAWAHFFLQKPALRARAVPAQQR